ncbi:VRR-NUC domain-containing protein [Pusillimonas noertemannii]|uniref:VRR-NUC domain-containing protein n=1 Tax=Pusillimonas noertemannii TaxID=305977 RepID=UPI0004746260|nr:VRR-NUC domain-containing protein [Pusillimonas noertemannii]
MAKQLDNPFYYLDNFEFVLNWVEQRYADILNGVEARFIQQYRGLPRASRALLARMVMRRGVLFRHSRLHYPEIGPVAPALAPLVTAGWVDDAPLLGLRQLFDLFTKPELLRAFAGQGLPSTLSKAAMYARMAPALPPCFASAEAGAVATPLSATHTKAAPSGEPHGHSVRMPPGHEHLAPLSGWWAQAGDPVCELLVMPLCERFRLMFFGNLRQDWSEFVLADLGLLRYETVAFSASCRALESRRDIDDYLHLHACSERLLGDENAAAIMACVSPQAHANPWIERRRAKLLFRIGQACERAHDWQGALRAYGASSHGEARMRHIRVLERALLYEPALLAAEAALSEPASEAEAQQLARMHPRLRRKLGLPVQAALKPHPPATLTLHAPPEDAAHGVEELARRQLHQAEAPAHYVENTLVNALFGLLCWEALFAPLPGAFFHPFQRGPADLGEPDFMHRRRARFDACLSQLDSGQYLHTIRANFDAKAGRQCSFVHWPALNTQLLQHALQCIPPEHLKKWFLRLLADISANRSGFPDLIQFWPEQRRYRMIEVKGPGDRLQDNQRRWLAYFAEHDMPVAVCFVQWADT